MIDPQLIEPLRYSRIITFDEVEAYSPDLQQVADDIHRRRPNGSLEDQVTKCIIGMLGEHAAKEMWNTKDIWSRFSKQETYQDRMFDLELIQRDKYEQWQPCLTKVDVKIVGAHCKNEYFAFNCYDNEIDEEWMPQSGRPGANLHFFIRKSLDTDLLLTMDHVLVPTGWLVTAKYLIHRKAFNKMFRVSKFKDSPCYYLRYEDMIRDGTCVKIPSQPT